MLSSHFSPFFWATVFTVLFCCQEAAKKRYAEAIEPLGHQGWGRSPDSPVRGTPMESKVLNS